MAIQNAASRIAAIALIAALSACDPAVQLAIEQDFDGAVDYDCIENALRNVVKHVDRSSYQADGSGPRGFPKGIWVTQFGYMDPSFTGYYTLDVALLPNGKTHYWHQWGKMGTRIQDDERAQVSPLLVTANKSVAQRCGLNFKRTALHTVEG